MNCMSLSALVLATIASPLQHVTNYWFTVPTNTWLIKGYLHGRNALPYAPLRMEDFAYLNEAAKEIDGIMTANSGTTFTREAYDYGATTPASALYPRLGYYAQTRIDEFGAFLRRYERGDYYLWDERVRAFTGTTAVYREGDIYRLPNGAYRRSVYDYSSAKEVVTNTPALAEVPAEVKNFFDSSFFTNKVLALDNVKGMYRMLKYIGGGARDFNVTGPVSNLVYVEEYEADDYVWDSDRGNWRSRHTYRAATNNLNYASLGVFVRYRSRDYITMDAWRSNHVIDDGQGVSTNWSSECSSMGYYKYGYDPETLEADIFTNAFSTAARLSVQKVWIQYLVDYSLSKYHYSRETSIVSDINTNLLECVSVEVDKGSASFFEKDGHVYIRVPSDVNGARRAFLNGSGMPDIGTVFTDTPPYEDGCLSRVIHIIRLVPCVISVIFSVDWRTGFHRL